MPEAPEAPADVGTVPADRPEPVPAPPDAAPEPSLWDEVASEPQAPDQSAPESDAKADVNALHDAKGIARDFLKDLVSTVKSSDHKLDAYNKFGINLFVAGAADAVARHASVPEDQVGTIVRESIRALGSSDTVARKFSGKMEEYLLEPKYAAMYRAGHEGLTKYLDSGRTGSVGIDGALGEYNQKSQSRRPSEIMAVMFTDIINSTAKTQELGDDGAQKMIHIHNQIVRTALTFHGGKEVKHMGDGIMASFVSPSESVAAAVRMQQDLLNHNDTDRDIAFEVRIGINAGEPIKEEGDLFGSTVQMAARVCAKANGYEVLVSDVVKQLIGNKYPLRSAGQFELKGFDQPVELFEVTWRESGNAADDPSKASASAESPDVTKAGP